MTEEEWRPVIGWEGLYEVSSLGRVHSLDRKVAAKWNGVAYEKQVKGRLLRLVLNRHGYLAGNMCTGGRRTNFEAHVLVCRAFNGIGTPDQQVAHCDGVRTNNTATNLRWATAAENAADRSAHGNSLVGSRNGRTLLSEAAVRHIRESSMSQRGLARQYGVSRGCIQGVLSGRNWEHLV